MVLRGRGESGGILRGPLPEDTTRTSLLVAMLTLAIYMAFIVDLKVLTTFKRRNTLYFWSILLASWGIMSHSTGIILKWFVRRCPWTVNTAFATFGWWGMVTGQSLVLYSRLHLVVRDKRVLRFVLTMVVVDFLLFQVPTTVLTFGSNQKNPGMWLKIYNVYERIQLIAFTLQELIISVIYIRAAFRMLQPGDSAKTENTRKLLIYLNMLCIVLDVIFVIQVYVGDWVYKTGTQSLAYAIKLSIEFIVLNKLMDIYRLGPGSCASCFRKFTLPGQNQDAYESPAPGSTNNQQGRHSVGGSPFAGGRGRASSEGGSWGVGRGGPRAIAAGGNVPKKTNPSRSQSITPSITTSHSPPMKEGPMMMKPSSPLFQTRFPSSSSATTPPPPSPPPPFHIHFSSSSPRYQSREVASDLDLDLDPDLDLDTDMDRDLERGRRGLGNDRYIQRYSQGDRDRDMGVTGVRR